MIIITIISIIMLVISEVLPFLPTKYNGIAHSLYICLGDTKKVFQDMEDKTNHDAKGARSDVVV